MHRRDLYVEELEAGDAPPGEVKVTELIVHGVGGAPPTDILGDFHPQRVSGDRHAGFYQPKDPPDRGAHLPTEAFPREAFAWGGLTSGDGSRALWFLLLPFALMNTSGWMQPPGETTPRRALFAKPVLRLLAASGTVMVVVMLAHLSLDLVGYQCGWRVQRCQSSHWWLSWLNGSVFLSHPGRILALAALVPLAGLSLLWFAGIFSFRRFEEYLGTGDGDSSSRQEKEGDLDIGLEHPYFWRGAAPVRRLRRLHFQLGIATIAVTLGVAAAELTAVGWSLWAKTTVWIGIALIIGYLFFIAHPSVTSSGSVKWIDRRSIQLGGWIVSFALLLSAGAYAIWGLDSLKLGDSAPRLEGMIPVATVLTGTQALLALLLVFIFIGRGTGSFFTVGPVIAQVLGWFMIISLWAGSGIRLADWFGRGEADASRFWHAQESTCTAWTFCYPLWFEDGAVAFAGILVLGALVAIVALLWPAKKSDIDAVAADFSLPGAERGSRRTKAVARKHRHSRLVATADEAVTMAVLIGILVFVIIGILQTGGWEFWSPIVTASGWIVTFVPLVVVAIVRLALRNPSARRAIGAVFDVLTFFPRRTHPFAPPCYGERAIPQLQWRLDYLTKADKGVVIRAHSQGTAITTATLLQRSTNARVALMTYGSPLVMLYERHFPAYFSDAVDRTSAALGNDQERWVHLYARTDVLGCRLECERSNRLVQSRVKDPQAWTSLRAGDPPPDALAHSTYHHHPQAELWANHLMSQMRAPMPPLPARPPPNRPSIDRGSDCCSPPCEDEATASARETTAV